MAGFDESSSKSSSALVHVSIGTTERRRGVSQDLQDAQPHWLCEIQVCALHLLISIFFRGIRFAAI